MALAMSVGPVKSLHAADQIEEFYKIGMDEATIQEKLRQGKTASLIYGEKIAEIALTYAGQAQGYFDCSLFVQTVLAQAGIEGPRSGSEYYSWGTLVDVDFSDPNLSSLQEGDVIGYDTMGCGWTTHVGIYVGNGEAVHVNTTFGYIEHCDIGLVVNYPITFVSRVKP